MSAKIDLEKFQLLDGTLLFDGNSLDQKSPLFTKAEIARAVKNIATQSNTEIFQYIGYSTGHKPGQSTGSLTLNFNNVRTLDHVRMIFNVDTYRQRTSKNSIKGSQRHKGDFLPPENGAFVKFWTGLEMEMPRKRCEYKNKLGRLKKSYFTGQTETCNYGAKFVDKHIQRATIALENHEVTVHGFRAANNLLITRQEPAKEYCQAIQPTPDSELDLAQSRCVSNSPRVKSSDYRGKYKELPLSAPRCASAGTKTRPQDQTNEEWLADYERIPF